jgi:hypothetical protein
MLPEGNAALKDEYLGTTGTGSEEHQESVFLVSSPKFIACNGMKGCWVNPRSTIPKSQLGRGVGLAGLSFAKKWKRELIAFSTPPGNGVVAASTDQRDALYPRRVE